MVLYQHMSIEQKVLLKKVWKQQESNPIWPTTTASIRHNHSKATLKKSQSKFSSTFEKQAPGFLKVRKTNQLQAGDGVGRREPDFGRQQDGDGGRHQRQGHDLHLKQKNIGLRLRVVNGRQHRCVKQNSQVFYSI